MSGGRAVPLIRLIMFARGITNGIPLRIAESRNAVARRLRRLYGVDSVADLLHPLGFCDPLSESCRASGVMYSAVVDELSAREQMLTALRCCIGKASASDNGSPGVDFGLPDGETA